jgi:hypothetical protein
MIEASRHSTTGLTVWPTVEMVVVVLVEVVVVEVLVLVVDGGGMIGVTMSVISEDPCRSTVLVLTVPVATIFEEPLSLMVAAGVSMPLLVPARLRVDELSRMRSALLFGA